MFAGNPESLLNSVWLNNGTYFGFRGRQDHTHLLWGDIQVKRTSTAAEYLEFTGNYIYYYCLDVILLITC